MPNGDPRDGFIHPTLTFRIDSYKNVLERRDGGERKEIEGVGRVGEIECVSGRESGHRGEDIYKERKGRERV